MSMKRLLLCVSAACVLVAGCQGVSEELVPEIPDPAPSSASDLRERISAPILEDHLITPELADLFVSLRFPGRRVAEATAVVEGDALVYLYNFDRGWALISSDTRTQTVLGLDEDSGPLDPRSLREEPLVGWYGMLCDELSVLRREDPAIENENTLFWESICEGVRYYLPSGEDSPVTRSPVPDEEHYVWGKLLIGCALDEITVNADIGHLLSTKWGQGHPWNVSMPTIPNTNTHLLTGCVATATAQILYYYHNYKSVPTFFYDSIAISDTYYTSTSNYGGYITVSLTRGNLVEDSPRWGLMPLDSASTNSALSFQYASDLMLDIGQRVNMQYSFIMGAPTSSGLSSGSVAGSRVHDVLDHYGLKSSYSQFNITSVTSDLKIYRPVIIYNAIHAWVADGFSDKTYTYKLQYFWSKIYDPTLWEECYEVDTDPTSVHQEGEEEFEYETVRERFMLINWGDDGACQNVHITINSSGDWTYINKGTHTSANSNIVYNIWPKSAGGIKPPIL